MDLNAIVRSFCLCDAILINSNDAISHRTKCEKRSNRGNGRDKLRFIVNCFSVICKYYVCVSIE